MVHDAYPQTIKFNLKYEEKYYLFLEYQTFKSVYLSLA